MSLTKSASKKTSKKKDEFKGSNLIVHESAIMIIQAIMDSKKKVPTMKAYKKK